MSFRRTIRALCVEATVERARALLDTGSSKEALAILDAVKARGRAAHDSECDLLRAQAFLMNGDFFAARQALLEEIRHSDSELAHQLFQAINEQFKPYLALPPDTVRQEPLFAMCYEGIQDHTMLSAPRLLSLFRAARALAEDGVDGDFVECGVAGGGSAILVALAFAHYDAASRKRRVFLCDSFAGMPAPGPQDRMTAQGTPASESHWGHGTCAGPVRSVLQLADTFGVSVEPIIGEFNTTLPKLPVDAVALLHCDVDWYESTRTVLEYVTPKLVPSRGVLQVDDYLYWEGCRKAVDEFFSTSGRTSPQWTAVDNNAVVAKIGSSLSR